MTEYQVGQVINGHVWTGQAWEPHAGPPPLAEAHPLASARNGLIPTVDPNVKAGSGKWAGYYFVKGKWCAWDDATASFRPANLSFWSRRHLLTKATFVALMVAAFFLVGGIIINVQRELGSDSRAVKDAGIEDTNNLFAWPVLAAVVVAGVLAVTRLFVRRKPVS